ncbi:unnamed protein product [Adineta ricciae]|uniref:Protein regulator of cytokinesis 1 n=1 Tax=Adineta ricciae TaxID=249248 RepID=A0A815AYB6_ADIRI|nr:unnamed protein product [Adineta ricciae]
MLQSKKTSIYPDLPLPVDKLNVLDGPTTCTEWHRLWSAFGFNDHQWTSRATKVEEYTRKLLADKLFLYKEQLNKRQQLLRQSLDDYEDLLHRTGLESSIETSSFEGLKLKEQEIYLDRKMHELLMHEDQLIRQRTELEIKQKHLCTLLHTTPIEPDKNIPLSLVQINQNLQEHVKMLSELKESRLAQVSTYYVRLKEYSELLEWTPSSSTVEHLLLQQYDDCLTADDLNEIEMTMRKLEHRIENQKARFSALHNQLGHLYRRLKKDPNKDYCLAYKTGCEHINAFVIKQLEHEIECCRSERMKNGKEYCQSIRQQIVDLLEKAHLNIEERATVEKLDFETLSPELLDAYDTEYERVSELYENRKQVLDAYHKWLSFWNDFVTFTKASTDPGRFHIRGYNAEMEARQRKKFHRELPIVEQEFLSTLTEFDDRTFLYDNVPIRQKFDEAHQQIPAVSIPINTPGRTPAATRLLGLTPVRTRTPVITPRRTVAKEPFVLGTAITNTARRAIKTPASNVARRLLSKGTHHVETTPARVKPRPPPPLQPSTSSAALQLSPPKANVELPVCPPTSTNDQSLDFSLLHTMKNIYGQIKIMTSTPNTSFFPVDNHYNKTAHNTIGERKSKRQSKRMHQPLHRIEDINDETIVCL